MTSYVLVDRENARYRSMKAKLVAPGVIVFAVMILCGSWAIVYPAEPTPLPSSKASIKPSSESPSSSISMTPLSGSRPASTVSQALLETTLQLCKADPKNNPKRHVSCVLFHDAILIRDEVHCELSEGNRRAAIELGGGSATLPGKLTFPPGGKNRYHMTIIIINFYEGGSEKWRQLRAAATVAPTPMGYFHSPVSGAQWINVWHTMADWATTLFHTVSTLLLSSESSRVTWITRPAAAQLNGRGCKTGVECRTSFALFDLFSTVFGGRVLLTDEPRLMKGLLFDHLLLGLNSRCSPIPDDNVKVDICQNNLRQFRDHVLRSYGLDPNRAVDHEERKCPSVHVMSRQTDKYRRMYFTNGKSYEDAMTQLAQSYSQNTGNRCGEKGIRLVKLHGGLSFREQIQSVHNSSMLVAGRGGGTALCIFLPIGGLYLSISGFDRWQPYRDLVPSWITMQHLQVKLVHHENPEREPQRFGSGTSSYIDPNRAAYKLSIGELDAAVTKAMKTLMNSSPKAM